MITAMRKHIKSRGFKIVLWICLLAVAGVFSVIELVKNAFTPAQWIAKVNGTTIGYPEFARKTFYQEQEIKAIRAQLGNYADLWFQMLGISNDPQEQALEILTQEALLDQAVKKTGIVADKELSKEWLRHPEFLQTIGDLVPPFALENGIINPQILRSYLQRAGVSNAEFESSLARALQRMIFTQLVKGAYYAPSIAVKNYFINEYAGKKFSIAAISFDTIKEGVKKEALDPALIQEYYDTHKNEYMVPATRTGSIWTFDPAQYGITLAPEEIAQYYQAHQSEYLEKPAQVQIRRILFAVTDPAQEIAISQKAEEVRAQLEKDPASFAKIAQEVSDDKESAAQGGLLPFFTKGTQEKQREMAAFVLKNDGDISPVIKTDKGFEILQRVARKAPEFKALTAVETQIKNILLKKKFAAQFAADARKVIDQAKSNPAAFDEFVKAKNAKKQSVSATSLETTPVAQALFKIKPGMLTTFGNAQEGNIIKLEAIKDSYIPELDAIKNNVIDDIYSQRAQEKIQGVSKSLKQLMAAGNFDAIQKMPGVTVEKTGMLKKADKNSLELLQRKGVPTNQLFQLEQIGSVVNASSGNHVYVMRLDEIAPLDQAQFDAKKDEIKQRLTQQEAMVLLNGVIASLYRNATIKFNSPQI
ncbi:MAG: peptidylprolyl isomerase [Candidatus Dependentiae bacterium]